MPTTSEFSCCRTLDQGRHGRIEINGKKYDYAQEPLPSDAEELACVRLSYGQTIYHVTQKRGWIECDCLGYLRWHDGKGTHCKHIRACVELGLFDEVSDSGQWLLDYVPQGVMG